MQKRQAPRRERGNEVTGYGEMETSERFVYNYKRVKVF